MYSDLFIVIQEAFGVPQLLGCLVVGYLLGSIPFGLLLTKAVGLGDVRKIGSGNIGATNVLRTGRKDIALATLILDGGKGAAAAAIAWHLYGPSAEVLAAIGAFLGHLFPVYLGFRGGKGVATFLGIALAVNFFAGLAACATWLLVAVLTRYSSLAALIATAATPVYAWYFYGHLYMEMAVLLAAIVWLRHRENIQRLVKGEESKIGAKKKD
ncbi:MAG: glycerol-3-phosphate 1-O-acyltransferase PlsY [Minwuia sp.]|uniref:glycerol-3-phosphate 1-O-acyltransferase PlsY n=1 Tax=Minwuia sp. TaxID=2493630 RepID=UPI003A87CC2B